MENYNLNQQMEEWKSDLEEQNNKLLEDKMKELQKMKEDLKRLMQLADRNLLMVSTRNEEVRKKLRVAIKLNAINDYSTLGRDWAICGVDIIELAIKHEPKSRWERKITIDEKTIVINGIKFILVEEYIKVAQQSYVNQRNGITNYLKDAERAKDKCDALLSNIEQIKNLVKLEDFDVYKEWKKERENY